MTEVWEERFWAKVDKNGPVHPVLGTACWVWTAQRHKDGYGLFKLNGRKRGAHQLAFELAYGPIPAGHVIRHQCDNTACVRFDHITSGTSQQNYQDMIERGRRPEYHPERITPELIKQIRQLSWYELRTQLEICQQVGLSTTVVGRILRNQTHRDVHPLCPRTATHYVQGADGYLRVFCAEHAPQYAAEYGGVVTEFIFPQPSGCYFVE